MEGIQRPTLDASPRDELSDEELLRLARGGDDIAFERLVRRWEDAAYRIAVRVLVDPAAAEDARQAVFVRLFQKAQQIGDLDRFSAWLRRAVINESISLLRRRKRAPKSLDGSSSDSPTALATQQAALLGSASGSLQHDALEVDEAARELSAALRELEPEDRALLSLKFDENLSFREIAETVGRPISTLKTRYQRAVEILRRRMKRT